MDPAAERLKPLLDRMVNYERTRPDRRLWDLANMRALLRLPGAGKKTAPAVQVGGSKGKGTTCAFLVALAKQAGLRTGAFLSPHVDTLLERIAIDGDPIAVEQLEAQLAAILSGATGLGRAPTFFEAMTAAAAAAFAAARVDLAVWEVGLGGRHDATTAIPVDASIVTGIELEHTDILGDTVGAIAAEKAWVIRSQGQGFTAARGEALAVIEAHAQSVGARLCVLGREWRYVDERWDGSCWRARLLLLDGRDLPVALADARAYEPPALALAAAAFAAVLPGASLSLDPAPRPALPCRFEVIPSADGEPCVVDGAHTEQSLQMVAEELQRRWPGRRASLLFGCAVGKRWREGLSRLLPCVDRVVVTGLSGTVGEDPSVLAAWLAAQGRCCTIAGDVGDGLRVLQGAPGPRLVTGSFYLAGEARRYLRQPQNDQHRHARRP